MLNHYVYRDHELSVTVELIIEMDVSYFTLVGIKFVVIVRIVVLSFIQKCSRNMTDAIINSPDFEELVVVFVEA